jgi:hypothetical protein
MALMKRDDILIIKIFRANAPKWRQPSANISVVQLIEIGLEKLKILRPSEISTVARAVMFQSLGRARHFRYGYDLP